MEFFSTSKRTLPSYHWKPVTPRPGMRFWWKVGHNCTSEIVPVFK